LAATSQRQRLIGEHSLDDDRARLRGIKGVVREQ
jgi:hypothetical protein